LLLIIFKISNALQNMLNPRLASRYAKSLIDLGTERKELDLLYADCVFLQNAGKASREYAAMLKSPVIKSDKKLAVIKAIGQGKISTLMMTFVELLVKKNREYFLSEILIAFMESYDKIRGINHIVLRTAAPVSDVILAQIKQKLEKETTLTNIDLRTEVNPDLIGGFVLEFDNNLIDASIKKYLKDVKSQFKSNDYIFNIR